MPIVLTKMIRGIDMDAESKSRIDVLKDFTESAVGFIVSLAGDKRLSAAELVFVMSEIHSVFLVKFLVNRSVVGISETELDVLCSRYREQIKSAWADTSAEFIRRKNECSSSQPH